MISAVCWVPKGASKAVPVAVEPPSKEEIEEFINSGALDRSEGEEDAEFGMEVDEPVEKGEDEVARARAAAEALQQDNSSSNLQDIADGLRELDMDHYDDEDDGVELFSSGLGDLYYVSNDMDPYLKNKDDDEEDEEIEDLTIKPTDAVIVCARSEDEVNQLEVLIFEESEDGDSNMYVHHEIILSAFPLCTVWLDCDLKSDGKGNFIAIGSMDHPAIEIWDLDIIEDVKPFTVLGGMKKQKGKKTPVKYKKGSHRDSVLGLAWNKEFSNALASASADKCVKVWDMAKENCVLTMEHHTDKVQAVAWNPCSPQILLSGSFDKTVAMMDVRSDSHVGNKWSVAADVESLAWDPHNEHSFTVSLDNGTVQGFDKRSASSSTSSGSKPSFTLHAHDKAVSSISYNPAAANFLATASTDKTVKLWDISNNQPSCLASRNPKAGAIFSISFSEDSPFLLAIGGSKGTLEVWDTLCDPGVANTFGNYAKHTRQSAQQAELKT